MDVKTLENKLACYEFFIWHSYNDTYVSLFQEAFGVEPSKEWGKDKDGNPVPLADEIKEIRNNFSPIYGTFKTSKEDDNHYEIFRNRKAEYGISSYSGQLYYVKRYTDTITAHGITSKNTENTKFKIFGSEAEMLKDRDADLLGGAGKVTIALPRVEPKFFRAKDGRDFVKLYVPDNNGHEFEDANRMTFVIPRDHYNADDNTVEVKTYHSTTLESSKDPNDFIKVSNVKLSEMFAEYYKDKYFRIWNIQPTIETSADEAEYDDEEER